MDTMTTKTILNLPLKSENIIVLERYIETVLYRRHLTLSLCLQQMFHKRVVITDILAFVLNTGLFKCEAGNVNISIACGEVSVYITVYLY